MSKHGDRSLSSIPIIRLLLFVLWFSFVFLVLFLNRLLTIYLKQLLIFTVLGVMVLSSQGIMVFIFFGLTSKNFEHWKNFFIEIKDRCSCKKTRKLFSIDEGE